MEQNQWKKHRKSRNLINMKIN